MDRTRTRTLLGCLLVALVVGFTAGACTPGTGAGSGSGPITTDELQELGAPNLYDAVQRLRPRWLRHRGDRSMTGSVSTELHVFMDGSHLGTARELRRMVPRGISSLEYLSASEADALPGPQGVHLAGAIMVHSR